MINRAYEDPEDGHRVIILGMTEDDVNRLRSGFCVVHEFNGVRVAVVLGPTEEEARECIERVALQVLAGPAPDRVPS